MTMIILGASILLQVTAAFLALSLIRITGRHYAWVLLAVAILLMALRHSITFVHLLSGHLTHTPELTAELSALTVSVFMVIGLAGLFVRRIFVDRVRYISAPSDFLMLIMLIVIGISGLVMQLVPGWPYHYLGV